MKYPLFKVHVPQHASMIEAVFQSGFINEGVQVNELKNKLRTRWNTEFLELTNSGTSALTLALKAANINSGDVVATVSMTCLATNTPIVDRRAYLRWIDIDPVSGMMCPRSLEQAIKEKKISAAIVVSWGGFLPQLEKLSEICRTNRIPLIIDAAHAFDAKIGDRFIHEFGDFTCYSFQAIKHFTTGDGGAIICKNEKDAERVRKLKWFGIDRDAAKDMNGDWKGQYWDFDVLEAGNKFNMNNIAASIGLWQLEHVDEIISAHRKNGEKYAQLFANCKKITRIPVNDTSPSYWVYTIHVPNDKRDDLIKILNESGVGAGLVHVPNHEYTVFKGYKRDLPGTNSFFQTQVSLPCGWWLSENDIELISKIVLENV